MGGEFRKYMDSPTAYNPLVSLSARRLEVLKSCITSIFENRISDAKKTFPAVIGALKARPARLALCKELASQHRASGGGQVHLEPQQFDMVARLMNAALQDDSDMDEYGVALALLPLSTVFGRKLSKGVVQFMYTVIQDHAVWQSTQFWESSFYVDVQREIRQLYLNLPDQNSNKSPLTSSRSENTTTSRRTAAADPVALVSLSEKKAILELVAREMEGWSGLQQAAKEERLSAEEQTVYSVIFVYVNYLVYLLCPLDMAATAAKRSRRIGDEYENASNSISNSMAESDSVDAESGFEDQEIPDAGQGVIRTVARFADRVCAEAGVTDEHVRAVSAIIPSTVAMHLEALEAVCAQARRLPPIQKSKITLPSLLPGETFMLPASLRVYLLPDGRQDNVAPSGVALLPAEGALFLTNYRVIFKGTPIDPFAAEHTVTRFFPVASLTKAKNFSVNCYLAEVEQHLKECIQLRSSTFQLMRAAFDDEVTADQIEMLRKALTRAQYPDHIFQLFAFRESHNLMHEPLAKIRDGKHNPKYSTIRGLASKTLKNVSKVAGYQGNKKRSKTAKYFLSANAMPSQGRLSIAEMTSHHGNGRIREEDESSEISETTPSQLHPSTTLPSHGANAPTATTSSSLSSTSKTLERLAERIYFHDWQRIGLISSDYVLSSGSKTHHQYHYTHAEPFRVTTANCRYGLCATLPALLLVPAKITDDSLRRYSRCHKQARLPTITWRHAGKGSLLLRGAGFHGRGVMGMIRRHHHDQQPSSVGGGGSSSAQTDHGSSIEAEIFTAAIIQVTPRSTNARSPDAGWRMSGSDLSINSLVASGGGAMAAGAGSPSEYHPVHSYPTLTPTSARKFNPLTKAMDTLTRSAAPAATKFGRISLTSMKSAKMGSQSSLASSTATGTGMASHRSSQRFTASEDSPSDTSGLSGFLQRTALFIFVDKGHVKGSKLESHPKVEFIPVEYPEPRRLRASFKKLLRACAPSTPGGASNTGAASGGQHEQTYLRQVEASEWLQSVQSIMEIAGAAVDLIDIQGASVSVCLEEGWDVTCQITSLAMLCMDPFYRTLEGFRVLVEKEWLSAGYRFGHRSGLTNPGQGDSGYTPVFLLFLDAVHQIVGQFPMAFEFNQFYVRFLAYHHVSSRFRTFLLDSEFQRFELGLLSGTEKSGSLPQSKVFRQASAVQPDSPSSDDEAVGASSKKSNNSTSGLGLSVFDYIDVWSGRAPFFHNLSFTRELGDDVLRPFSHISDLRIWDFFVSEELRHGPPYDLELYDLDKQEEELNSLNMSGSGGRRSVASGYDALDRSLSDGVIRRVGEVCRLQNDSPSCWQELLEHAEECAPAAAKVEEALIRQVNSPVIMRSPSINAKHHGRLAHKRNTMELLMKGKVGAGGASGPSSAEAGSSSKTHRLEKYNFPTPTSCDVCSALLWGPVRPGYRCADSGANVCEKCKEILPNASSRFRASARGGEAEGMERLGLTVDLEGSVGNAVRRSGEKANTSNNTDADDEAGGGADLFRRFAAARPADENSKIICQGYLYKQANFRIKGWKQRWFVLDATKHQLRYYDTREDFTCRGHIDLSEVTRVASEGSAAAALPNAPKKTDDDSFFELCTLKRTYCFCAENASAAADWVAKIHSCLSS